MSAENQGPRYIADQCYKLMEIWKSLPDAFIILYYACWAYWMLFMWTTQCID